MEEENLIMDNKNWSVKLTKKSNGFVVDFSGGDVEISKVYQQKEDSLLEDSFEHYVEIFYDIMEYFADFNSKHRKKNIEIKYKGIEEQDEN